MKIFAISALLLFSSIFPDQELKKDSDIIKKLAFFPGAGQIYNKEYLKGASLFILNAYSVLQAINFSKTTDVVSRNHYIWWSIAIYVYNIMDAHVEAELNSFPDKEDILNEKDK